LILLGLLVAVVAVGVVVSSSGAEPPPPSGCKSVGTPSYCIAGVPLVSASEKIEGTNSGTSVLKTTIASVEAEVTCEKGKSKGTIEGGAAGTVGKSTMTDTLEKCKLIKPENCELTEADEQEIKTGSLGGELVLTSGRVEDKLKPKSGSTFAVVGIEGKEPSCVISHVAEEKTYPVTGSQLCEVDKGNAEAETEAKTHSLTCKTSGSSLNVGGNKAEMTSEATVNLTSGKNWSVKET